MASAYRLVALALPLVETATSMLTVAERLERDLMTVAPATMPSDNFLEEENVTPVTVTEETGSPMEVAVA